LERSLAPAEILIEITKINSGKLPVYLVGGAVRDRLLGREIHDYDFVVFGDSRPLAQKIADRLEGAFYALDEERKTYRVILMDPGGLPIVLDFSVLRGNNLEEDLAHRDFTINALAVNLKNLDEIIDPLNGRADLQAKILRACNPNSISDDPVRSLRAVRLEAILDIHPDQTTMNQISKASGMLSGTSAERLRDELFKIFDVDRFGESIQKLEEHGLLSSLIPEISPLKGMPQPAPHIYSGLEHTLAVVSRLEEIWRLLVQAEVDLVWLDPDLAPVLKSLGQFHGKISTHSANSPSPLRSLRSLLVFSTLLHDCAKPFSTSFDSAGRIRFFNHDKIGAEIAGRRARALALSTAEVERIETTVEGHMRVHQFANESGEVSPRAIYRYFRATSSAGIDICLLSLADVRGTYGEKLPEVVWRKEIDTVSNLMAAYWNQTEKVVSPPRLISGKDLISEFELKPGPTIGKLLEAVQEAQAAGEVDNREEALAFAKTILNEV
jgi:tRNA nucleotidyltransferase/poly(A) polymerase